MIRAILNIIKDKIELRAEHKDEACSISDLETLARFVFQSNRIRKDNSVKPEAFMPNNNLETSVTIKSRLEEKGLWEIGKAIANQQTLYGHASVRAVDVRNNSALDVVFKPAPGNPYHANIIGWPQEKEKRKSIAQVLADAATFYSNPQL